MVDPHVDHDDVRDKKKMLRMFVKNHIELKRFIGVIIIETNFV